MSLRTNLALPLVAAVAFVATPSLFAAEPSPNGKATGTKQNGNGTNGTNGTNGKKNGAKDEGKPNGEGGRKAASSAFAVIQIGDEVLVVKDPEIGAARDKAKQDYEADLKAYNDAKQAAQKAKKKLNDTKPVRPTFKIVATALKSEEDARALKKKTDEKIEKQKQKDRDERIKAKAR